MKPEINAATDFLSRVFLTHDRVSQEKVAEFKKHLATLLEERFLNHWHESSPTKGQAFRCIRICPDEALDPILERVCHDVGINTGDFLLPFELTLWVDPTEVVCKFGDLKCSYHTVAKKDETSGALDNQTKDLDIEDLVENARELYIKKQSVVIHPINSSEMHIPYNEGSPNGFTMAIRMNGTMHYDLVAMNGVNSNGGVVGTTYDGSPRGKGRTQHSLHHKHRNSGNGASSYHYYGKASGGKGGSYLSNGTSVSGSGYQHHHRASNNNHHHHHHNQHHHHSHHHHHQQHHSMGTSPYSNSYLNGYAEEMGGSSSASSFGYDHRSGSPTKLNGNMSHPPPPISSSNGNSNTTGQIGQSSPTPEQIQQQMLHPPPMPPHLQQAYPPDTTTLPPPPSALPSSSTSTAVPSSSSTSSSLTVAASNNSVGGNGTTPNGKSTKYPNARSGGQGMGGGSRNKQGSPAKEMKYKR